MNEIFKNKIVYEQLNARQKEIYNFQKVSSVLADYGYTTIKLADDWMGADFIALNFNGNEYLKIQLKGRLTFDKKYIGKEIYICFFDECWYIYPHDEFLLMFLNEIEDSVSWQESGKYSYPYLNKKNMIRLERYKL